MIESSQNNNKSLSGLRVLDMSRILAGPNATQILGDLGAEIIKVERPNIGDDTRKWGPPFLKDGNGDDTNESSYYLSANRNKKSITIDFTNPDGIKLLKELIAKSDILVENYKTGNLKKYGLDYTSLKADFPNLIYCSLTGFGQTGPYKDRAGYDFLIQAMGGLMSLTGVPDGEPMKTGVAISDIMAGMYMNIAILSALNHRNNTGEGQYIDISLLDSQVAWLSNAAQYYLTTGDVTPRMGNAHPTIVPYQVFQTLDSYIVLAIGNDKQFQKFCSFAELNEISEMAEYKTNQARVKNRDKLIQVISKKLKEKTSKYWISGLEAMGVPSGPVNDLEEVFDNEQVLSREMIIPMKHADTEQDIKLVGNPIKMSKTPVSYDISPPVLGENTDEILREVLEYNEDKIKYLKERSII